MSLALLSCGRTEQDGSASEDVALQQREQDDSLETSDSDQDENNEGSVPEVDSISESESPDKMQKGREGSTTNSGGGGTTSIIEPRDDCRSVTGGGTKPWFDLLVKGSGFTDENGVRARVIAQVQDGYRFGLGDAVIQDGKFQIDLKQSLNDGSYVNISVYLDRDMNDSCNQEEHLIDFTTGIVNDDYQLDLSPLKLCTPEFGGSCSPRSEPVGSCNANGFDLTQLLTCE